MPQTLSKPFPASRLKAMDFGSLDGESDRLIREELCICKIKPIRDFLQDRTSILLGERGAGKSAVFQLLATKGLSFQGLDDQTDFVALINGSIEYKSFDASVERMVKSSSGEDRHRHRIVWELFLLHYLRNELKALGDLPKELNNSIEFLEKSFHIPAEKPSLFDVIINTKKKFGVKVDTSVGTGLPTFDAYVQVSPNEERSDQSGEALATLELYTFKRLANEFLQSRKSRVYLLIDRLDEFVIRDEYTTQKNSLEALLATVRSYQDFPQIRIKVALRADLFRKLDLRELGADKVMSYVTRLEWRPADIREFLAKRILRNMFALYGISWARVQVGGQTLRIDNHGRIELEAPHTTFVRDIGRSLLASVRRFGRSIFGKRDELISFNDQINHFLISRMFEGVATHTNGNGNRTKMDLVSYLETHFCLNTGESTPRIMLMYLAECHKIAHDNYEVGPPATQSAPPIISSDSAADAYESFKKLFHTAVCLESKMPQQCEAFLKRFGSGRCTALEISQELRIPADRELDEFLAILNHLGVITCENKNLPLQERHYSLPILFRSTMLVNRPDPEIMSF